MSETQKSTGSRTGLSLPCLEASPPWHHQPRLTGDLVSVLQHQSVTGYIQQQQNPSPHSSPECVYLASQLNLCPEPTTSCYTLWLQLNSPPKLFLERGWNHYLFLKFFIFVFVLFWDRDCFFCLSMCTMWESFVYRVQKRASEWSSGWTQATA